MMSALQASSLHLISQSLKHKHCKLKPVLTAVLLAFAASAQAATLISTGNADITADPNAAPAVSITDQHVLVVSTPVITGDVTTTAGNQGALVLNGTTTINGNIGTATNFLSALVTGLNYNFTSRLADGDVYRLNGLVNVGVFYINFPNTLPDGLSFNSSVILGGDLNANQGMYWFAPITGKVSTLDLQGNVLVSGTSLFVENAGDLRLISTITADGGQTACIAGANKAGCISSGISTALPANLQVQVRVANGVTLTTGTKYNLIDLAPGGPVAPTLSSNITSLTSGFSFVQDTANTEDIVFEVTGVPVTIPFFVSNANVKVPAKPAAAVLDELSATATDSGMIAAISALQGLSPAQQAATLNRIAPETSRASIVASMQTINGALDSVQARIEGERDKGFNLSLTDDLQQGKVKLATNGDTTGLFNAGDNRSFWVKGFGAHGNQNETNSYAGYNSNTWGAAFGADTLLSNNWLVGAAFTYARTGVNMSDFRSGDETNIKTYQINCLCTNHQFDRWKCVPLTHTRNTSSTMLSNFSLITRQRGMCRSSVL